MGNSLKLYKYRSLSTCEDRKRVKRMFTENLLYFAGARQLNDPFECKYSLSFDATEEQKREALQGSIARMWRNGEITTELQAEAWRQARRQRIAQIGEDKWNEERRKDGQELAFAGYGICSLCEVNDSIIMWSQYADQHTGICTEFDFTSSHLKEFPAPFKLCYKDEFPRVNVYTTPPKEKFTSAMLRKAKDWEYEQERRLLDFEQGPGNHRFPNGLLTGVILGARISPDHRRLVQEWVCAHSAPLTTYEARPIPEQYALEIVPVT